MDRLRMCESVDTRLSIATPAFQHPRIIKSPPESLGTRLSYEQLQTPREDWWWGTSQLTPGLFGDRDNTSVVNYAILGLRPRTA